MQRLQVWRVSCSQHGAPSGVGSGLGAPGDRSAVWCSVHSALWWSSIEQASDVMEGPAEGRPPLAQALKASHIRSQPELSQASIAAAAETPCC